MARASQAARSTIRCSHYAEVVLVRRVERNIEQAAQSSRGAEDTIVSLAANSPVLHRSHEVLQDDVRAVQRCPSGVTRRGRRPLSRQARAGRFGSGFECSCGHRGPRRIVRWSNRYTATRSEYPDHRRRNPPSTENLGASSLRCTASGDDELNVSLIGVARHAVASGAQTTVHSDARTSTSPTTVHRPGRSPVSTTPKPTPKTGARNVHAAS